MEPDAYYDWTAWAIHPGQYINNDRHGYRRWGTWCGEGIGYVIDEKMLQLVQFKLGPNINKIIEFQLREN